MQYAIEIGSNCNFQVSQSSEVAIRYDVCAQNLRRNLTEK